jgi:hypothetical protein
MCKLIEPCLDHRHEPVRRQALEERPWRDDLLYQPDPRLVYHALGERSDHPGCPDCRPGSLLTAGQTGPDPPARTLDFHGNPVPITSLVSPLQPRAETLDPLLSTRPASKHRCHP